MLQTEQNDGMRSDHLPDTKRTRLAKLLRSSTGGLPRAPGEGLHDRFAAQARRTPDAIALSCGEQSLTYRALDLLSNRMARRLRDAGAGSESLVGLCAERSLELIVGLLGILKSGAAYVPLDPSSPADRLQFQLDDSGARILLAQHHLVSRLPTFAGQVVSLDPVHEVDPEPEAASLDAGGSAQNLAYVIYTSGSTGTPKGVAVTHANVIRLFTATEHWFQFNSQDVFTFFHSFAFDFSVWEIWGALLYGGRLVIVPYWVSRSPETFHNLLRAERVTVLNQTPSAFRQLVRVDERAGDLNLRLVIFGGEALELQSLRPWFNRHDHAACRLVNMYGITETTVHVTYRPITPEDLEECAGASPIGRAIPDLKLYVLDDNMQPVPPGAVGEAYVGGEGLARGYLGQPGLTAERFLPNPFATSPGGRLYRSGDLLRVKRNGDIDYAGRSDRQVKIRGFRIELGEIEAALTRQPELHEAVVMAQAGPRGDEHLVAYIVPRVMPGPSTEALRQRLRRSLPEYMVPAAYVALERLPLTTNGKLDARSLPPFDWNASARERGEFVAPRSPTEESVAAVWADILEVTPIGIHDDFFTLGGHSLLAAQVVSRLRYTLGIDIPLRMLFEAPTVAGLAARIESSPGQSRSDDHAPIPRINRQGELPLSFSQQALWFLERLSPGTPVFNVTAAVRITGLLDVLALERSFDTILERHEALRTTFPAIDGRPVAVIAPHVSTRSGLIDLSALPESQREAEARRLAVVEARRPFELASGPLLRVLLLRLGDREHMVLLTIHHMVTDGWSMGVAALELAALYEDYSVGKAPSLPELPIQYADYAAWQRQYLQGAVLADLLAYWSERLDGLVPLNLPTDRPRPAVRSARGDTRFFTLSPELSAGLGELGLRGGTTPFMTALAALQVLLGRYCGQDDIAVGVPVANRTRPEIESLVGYFVNMLVMRTDLSGDPTFRTLLKRVRETALSAFEHQELPFDKLVEVLQPARDLSRAPLFDVMFVLQNNKMPDSTRQELRLGHLDVGQGTGTAKFDLTLALVEDDDRLSGSLEYNSDLFDAATIDRMIEHFRIVLEAVVANPDTRLSEISLLGDSERVVLLEQWHQTAPAIASSYCVHELFAAQAKRTPGDIAVRHSGRALTYRELDARSNRLAHFLKARGVRPETRVGLLIDRSMEMTVGILGILKAGGAFVPLDPSEPAPRMAAMAKAAELSIVLTRQTFLGHITFSDVDLFCLDTEWTAISRLPDHQPAVASTPECAAYVIFTSGSTGTPRGVTVTHRSVVNHNLAAAALFGLGPGDRVLQFSPLHFDLAVEEILPTWISGATLVLRKSDDALDPRRFTDWIEKEGITVLDLPTAYWHSWVNWMSQRARVPGGALRLVVVGGERALSSAHADWRSLVRDRVRWLNTYGPTETTVIATAYEPPACDSEISELPIGRPIAGAAVYVLDRNFQPVPVGQPGELYIGGAGVSRGYLGCPASTAERFLPNPFTSVPGERFFRTGDLVRSCADGELLFLGRLDFQAKLRGFRVEPGEIEMALLEHPNVRAATVMTRQSGSSEESPRRLPCSGQDPRRFSQRAAQLPERSSAWAHGAGTFHRPGFAAVNLRGQDRSPGTTGLG